LTAPEFADRFMDAAMCAQKKEKTQKQLGTVE